MNKKYINFPISLCHNCAKELGVKMNNKRMIEDNCFECSDFIMCYQLETLLEKK